MDIGDAHMRFKHVHAFAHLRILLHCSKLGDRIALLFFVMSTLR